LTSFFARAEISVAACNRFFGLRRHPLCNILLNPFCLSPTFLPLFWPAVFGLLFVTNLIAQVHFFQSRLDSIGNQFCVGGFSNDCPRPNKPRLPLRATVVIAHCHTWCPPSRTSLPSCPVQFPKSFNVIYPLSVCLVSHTLIPFFSFFPPGIPLLSSHCATLWQIPLQTL